MKPKGHGLLLALLALACESVVIIEPLSPERTKNGAASSGALVEISLIATTDVEGRVQSLPLLAGYLANLRAAHARNGGAVALFDAGDIIQGTLESNLNEGRVMLEAYDALGYSAATIGNHEFDHGPEGEAATPQSKQPDDPLADPRGALKARLAEAKFPFVVCNLIDKSTGQRVDWQNVAAHNMVDLGVARLGVVGAITLETPAIVMPANFAGLDVVPPAECVESEAKALREAGADVVVLLTHSGGSCQEFDDPKNLTSCKSGSEVFELARTLPPNTVDAIFAGHTHSTLAHEVAGTPVLEAWAHGKGFSRVDLTLDTQKHQVVATKIHQPQAFCRDEAPLVSCQPFDYEGKVVRSQALEKLIAPYVERAEARRKEPVGIVISQPVIRKYDAESPLGNLYADLMLRSVPKADVAVLNGGSLRSDLPAGPLDYGTLYESQPFDNRLASFRISAGAFKEMLLRHFYNDQHGIVSLAGLRVRVECGQADASLQLLRADGAAVENRTILTVVTSDYLATGGDGVFAGFEPESGSLDLDLGTSVRDALRDRLRERGKLDGEDPKLFDPKHPRLELPAARPIPCERDRRPR